MIKNTDQAVRAQLVKTLRGGNAFETFDVIVREIPMSARFVTPEGKGRSAWQIIDHMRFTLEDLVSFTDNAEGSYQEKEWPSDYWPKSESPENPDEWDRSIQGFHKAQSRMEKLILDERRDLTAPLPWGEGQTLLHEALLAIEHAAYHLGELVQLTADSSD